LSPTLLLAKIVGVMESMAAEFDLTGAEVRGWADRNRSELLALLQEHMEEPAAAEGLGNVPTSAPPDEWTASRRTAANVAAMEALARMVRGKIPPSGVGEDERQILATYSGWGGLSIQKAAERFPAGIPHPDPAGLIHEYYTPSRVAEAVAGVVLTRLDTLPSPAGGLVRALEPSAGIGRFLRYLQSDRLVWAAAELSPLSSLLLSYLYPRLALRPGSFEGWAAENASIVAGKIGLVVANPPYGARGAERVEDPDRAYSGFRKSVYHYFLRRASDLLARGGLGVWLIPMGFLHARSGPAAELRETMLLRQHIAAAFRLPSTLFPGANIVTDLVIMRARGGDLPEILPADRYIAEGRYFDAHPEHVLGTIVGEASTEGDTGKVGRRWMRIEGEFTGLPDFAERPLDDAVPLRPFVVGTTRKGRGGITREEVGDLDALPPWLGSAVRLGQRVDGYLAAVAAGDGERARGLQPELLAALQSWVALYGKPIEHKKLREEEARYPMVSRFLVAFRIDGRLSEAMETVPKIESRWQGAPEDLAGQAMSWYLDHRSLVLAPFLAWGQTIRPPQYMKGWPDEALVQMLLDRGWSIPYGTDMEGRGLVPAEDYLAGFLWPKYDAALAASDRATTAAESQQAQAQAGRLLTLIAPRQYEDIGSVDPRMGWIPLEILAAWVGSRTRGTTQSITLVREDGLLQIKGISYRSMSVSESGGDRWGLSTYPTTAGDLARILVETMGWLNHDFSLWRPRKGEDENIHEVRGRWEIKALDEFTGFAAATEERREAIAANYNRMVRGFVPRSVTAEPLTIARWKVGPRTRPHPWQNAGARRVLERRGGLVAFDVGVGKTLTGLLVLAKAREEGWARRPVLLVPRSLLWKWKADIGHALPDYEVVIVGSSLSRKRDGTATTRTDDVDVMAQKWSRFQAGAYDVAICSYESFARIQVKASSLRRYAQQTAAIARLVKLKQDALKEKEGKGKTELTEREQAILDHGVAGWLAEKLEPPKGQPYVPGITWEDLGVDLLIVDELQNFKNLYMPAPRGSAGVPKFMGSGGEGSSRAWSLDFRAALVRENTGGAGIVGLSATPAKNSPLEFYNVVQFIDHGAWDAIGIPDPESFIDRFIKLTLMPVINADGTVERKLAATAFGNLDEIRDVLDRYAEFQTAESVSQLYPDRALVLPEPTSRQIVVEMEEGQADRYEKLRQQAAEIREAMRSGDAERKAAMAAKLLGVMARMALVSLHPALADSGWDWKTAGSLPEYEQDSAKIEAVGKSIKGQPGCGHIVFAENVAVHVWLRDVLARKGIVPVERIAVLNAAAVPDSGTRVKIAEEFNGSEFEPAKFDVVIANSVAYEGIDLQRRTCQIHHMDLPWEPATIQQRNGRGVRQGNTREVIGINYYLARGSFDAVRFQMIAKKRGWLTTLVESQDRETNNPGAQSELSGSEIAALIAGNPQEAQKLLEEAEGQIRAEKLRSTIATAEEAVRSVNVRLRKIERTTDQNEASRYAAEAKEIRARYLNADPAVWPWASLVERHINASAPFISRTKVSYAPPPLFPGMRWRQRGSFGFRLWEAGTLGQGQLSIQVREPGRLQTQTIELNEKEWFPPESPILPEDLNPPDWDPESGQDLDLVEKQIRNNGSMNTLRYLWSWAPGSLAELWPRVAPHYARMLAKGTEMPGGLRMPLVPVMQRGGLHLVSTGRAEDGDLLSPGNDGWAVFVAGAPEEAARNPALRDRAWSILDSVARSWWGRNLPRAVLKEPEA